MAETIIIDNQPYYDFTDAKLILKALFMRLIYYTKALIFIQMD